MAEVEEEAAVSQRSRRLTGRQQERGRPHIASVMIRKARQTKQDAFDKFLARGGRRIFTRFAATRRRRIQQIQARRLAILAQSAFLKAKDRAELDGIVADLKGKGLDGIEVWYSTHTAEDTGAQRAAGGQIRSGLLRRSDFQWRSGRGNTHCELGSGVGNTLCIPYSSSRN